MNGTSKSDGDNSENPSYFVFAKNCQIPTTFGFELRHIPMVFKIHLPEITAKFDG